MGPRGGPGTLKGRFISLSSIEPRFLSHMPRDQVSIPNELSRLPQHEGEQNTNSVNVREQKWGSWPTVSHMGRKYSHESTEVSWAYFNLIDYFVNVLVLGGVAEYC